MDGIALSDSSALAGSHTPAGLRDYWRLLKPGVMALVVFTAAAGMVAAPTQVGLAQTLTILLAIALGSGAGAAINMWYDADIDAVMQRTRKRPIPSGKIAADDVLILALSLAVLSVGLLGLVSNWAAAGLLAFAIWFYGCFYTMLLKRRTAQNIVIGGAAGAFPPVIGWLGVHPVLTLEPLLYFLIIFLWTPPHFWALALYRHEDYATARIPMLPVVAGERSTLHHILAYTVLMLAASIAPAALDYASIGYGLAALALGAVFLYKALRLWRAPEPRLAISLFLYSILYLFLLFSALMMDRLWHMYDIG